MCEMLQNLKGKKLLILAGSPHEEKLVKRAKELGIYTIVTDYYDKETSPAKKIADEAWNVSWSDLDALEKKCLESNVDGVTAGYSEFTVENMIKLCERLEKPCYCNEEQLEITRNKVLFKEECRKNGVPVVNEYSTVEMVNSYPVIVKPVDRGGSIGISVATNKQELDKAYAYAMEMSVCKKVIIEDFIYVGTKFDAYYAISDGDITLLSTSDTVNAASNGFEKIVQSGWLFPSKYHDDFTQTVDRNLRKMISNMGIKNGYIFFSGFADGKKFVFFETGFRLSGGHMYSYIKKKNGMDIQDLFIAHALTGETRGIIKKEVRYSDLKCAIVNFYAKSGKLAELKGMDEISKMQDFGLQLITGRIGQECKEDKAILSKLAMFHVYSESSTQLKEDIEYINQTFAAKDTNGKDMVYDRIDSSIVSEWWD